MPVKLKDHVRHPSQHRHVEHKDNAKRQDPGCPKKRSHGAAQAKTLATHLCGLSQNLTYMRPSDQRYCKYCCLLLGLAHHHGLQPNRQPPVMYHATQEQMSITLCCGGMIEHRAQYVLCRAQLDMSLIAWRLQIHTRQQSFSNPYSFCPLSPLLGKVQLQHILDGPSIQAIDH